MTLAALESSGAVTGDFERQLRFYGSLADAPGTTDLTCYGESRSSPKSYYRHHLAALCSEVVFADAETVLHKRDQLGCVLLRAPPGGAGVT